VTSLRLPGQYDERLFGSLGLQGPYYNWNRNSRYGAASIAVILTVVGYSVNDTVVVYDRIRENQGKLKGGRSARS
jgi:hypothetical protein